MLGLGTYTFREAAKLTHLKYSRVREWFVGKKTRKGPVFESDYETVEEDIAISFHDLIDVFVAGQLRDQGVSMQTVRRVYSTLSKDFETKHPFCRKELLSDGKQIFFRGLDTKGRDEVVEVLTKQKAFPRIILPFLRSIDYGKVTKLAERWKIDKSVVVDPQICFGNPIIEQIGIPTSILSSAYYANEESADAVADWYDIHRKYVISAVQFEANLSA